MITEQRLASSARTLDAAIDEQASRSAGHRRRRQQRSRAFSMAAAALIAVAGMVGLYQLGARGGPEPHERVAASQPMATESPSPTTTVPSPTTTVPLAPTAGSLLTTPVPSDARPLPVIGQPGWTVEKFAPFARVALNGTTEMCVDCGSSRLVVASDGPLFSGSIFTAWTHDESDLSDVVTPVMIGATAGHMDQPIGMSAVPVERNFVMLSWPINDGRFADVVATGLSNEQVLAMAGSLTFESQVPAMLAPPAGFSVRATASLNASMERVALKFVNGERILSVYATNLGMQGVVDPRGVHNPMLSSFVPLTLDGVTTAFFSPTEDAPPTNGAFVTWVAGGWSYTAVGWMFATKADFLSVVSSLHLTDSATFNLATAGAERVPADLFAGI